MKKKNIKPLVILGFIGLCLLLLYWALPKVYVNTQSIQLEVEAYEYYDPKILLEDYVNDESKLYIQTNLGWKEQGLNTDLKIADKMVIKLVSKDSMIRSKETTFEITGIDTKAPIIEISDEKIILEGGENLKNHINFKVMDYRYGAYDYELKKPDISFVATDLGNFTYTLIAEDLSGNKTEAMIDFEVVPYVLSQEESKDPNVWITKARRLDNGFVPDLEDIPKDYTYPYRDRSFKLEPEALKNFVNMADALQKETRKEMLIESAYRDYDAQEALHNGTATQEANTFTARPGHSEHEAGFAVDVRTQDKLSSEFASTEQYDWIQNNAHRFGYIVRYQEDKQDNTNYIFEPWHLRYVGEEVASFMFNNKISFDEYIIQNLN